VNFRLSVASGKHLGDPAQRDVTVPASHCA
jgi:hypothetical protein